MLTTLQRFIKSESAGGLVLVAATVLAMLVANGPWAASYHQLLGVVAGSSHDLSSQPLLFWVNDGLMAVFFYLVGLELKRELVEGELAELRQAMLPIIAAVGGMLVPALIYIACTYGNSLFLRGWAIPSATDIAFALGVLSLLGSRIPHGLKVFLVSLAIIDDIGAVLIIALFYSHGIAPAYLGGAALCLLLMAVLNWRGVGHFFAYLPISLLLWYCVLNSGVHATLAGVVAAFFIPMRSRNGKQPLKAQEERLHGPVAFFILPVFAFCNAGIPLAGLSLASLAEPVPLGIGLGLLLGKQLGVFSFALLAVKARLARLPAGVGWLDIHGVAVLCGIGFTMSLFITGLAFDGHGAVLGATSRLAILVASILSAVTGYLLLAHHRRIR
ncbi:Na+/H+ antiporter NhaA [Chitinimonas sp.]|uniref:Na+/H+ antiporter NhaA n=1 Tax=Chitinimonas sp. TaxID=1934313 RepID=UPI0035AFF950